MMISEVVIEALIAEDARNIVSKLLSYMGIHADIRKSAEYEDKFNVHVFNVTESECAKIRLLSDCVKAERITVKGTQVASKIACDITKTIVSDIIFPGIANAVKYGYKGGEELKEFKKKLQEHPEEGGRIGDKIKNKFKLPFKVTIERR